MTREVSDVIWARILYHIDDAGTLNVLRLVNKQLRNLASADYFWRRLCLCRWPDRFPPSSNSSSNRERKLVERVKGHVDERGLPIRDDGVRLWIRYESSLLQKHRNTGMNWRNTYMHSMNFDLASAQRLAVPSILRSNECRFNPDGQGSVRTKSNTVICTNCMRPQTTCFCPAMPLEKIHNQAYIDLVVLLHPKCHTSIGTVQILMRLFESCRVFVDIDFSTEGRNPEFDAIMTDPESQTFLLYPGFDSVDVGSDVGIAEQLKRMARKESEKKRVTLVVIDGSWRHARYIYRWNPRLQRLQSIHITPSRPSIYGVLKKEPDESCICTAEAVGFAIADLDRHFKQALPRDLIDVLLIISSILVLYSYFNA